MPLYLCNSTLSARRIQRLSYEVMSVTKFGVYRTVRYMVVRYSIGERDLLGGKYSAGNNIPSVHAQEVRLWEFTEEVQVHGLQLHVVDNEEGCLP